MKVNFNKSDLGLTTRRLEALVISCFSPSWSGSVYFLLPFLHHYKRRKQRVSIEKKIH